MFLILPKFHNHVFDINFALTFFKADLNLTFGLNFNPTQDPRQKGNRDKNCLMERRRGV